MTPSPIEILVGASEIASACAVGVDRDEVHLRDAGVHHAVDRVEAGAADADDADRGDVGGALRRRHAVELRRRLEHRLEVARRGARGGGLGGDGSLLGLDDRGCGSGREARARRVGRRLRLAARSRGRARRSRRARPRRVGSTGCRLGLGGALLGALRRLGLAEELGERALTHRRALARHRAPPSRGRGTPRLPARTGRT